MSPQENPQTDCFFCRRMEDRAPLQDVVIYEDNRFHVSHHLTDEGDESTPSYLGMVLIQTKRHVNDLAALTEAESSQLGKLTMRLSRAIKAATGAAWTYCYCFLEGYRHVHVFLAARYPGMPEEYIRLNLTDWPGAPSGSRKEVSELCHKLRSMVNYTPLKMDAEQNFLAK